MSATDHLTMVESPAKAKRGLLRRLIPWAFGAWVLAVAAIAAIEFPYDVDAPLSPSEADANREYYAEAYKTPAPEHGQGVSPYESRYTQTARAAAEAEHVEEQVKAFVKQYRLENRPVLEIGSGRGYLQDVAEDYTGLDVSPSVRRYYHKTFVLGSATSLPFPDDRFDGAWSIWVFEHVPNPEQAFRELRRVMRDGAVVFLLPAWDCDRWAADGYAVRPYSDFGLGGKLIKASIPIRRSRPYKTAALLPNRVIRNAAYGLGGPTRLHYRRLVANYNTYWGPDSDAVNALGRYEVMLWFLSRGDECLNCQGASGSVLLTSTSQPLIIRIHK